MAHSERDRDWRRSREYDRSDRRREYSEAERRPDGSCRKKPRREEARTSAQPFGNDDRSEPSPKRARYSHSSRVKSDGFDVRHQGTSILPHASSDRRRKDNEQCPLLGSDYSKRSQTLNEYGGYSHERDRHRRSHKNSDHTSSESNFIRGRERGRERDNYGDRSPRLTRQKLQLSADGAASPQKRREVVPYASSKASSSSSRDRHYSVMKDESMMKVLSMVDMSFVPSLPGKYYSRESDQVLKILLIIKF